MKERGLIFSGPMVRANLEGRKTQTRRVIKEQPQSTEMCPVRICTDVMALSGYSHFSDMIGEIPLKNPWGVVVGDRFYMRETWSDNHSMHYAAEGPVAGILYRATANKVLYRGENVAVEIRENKWVDYYDRPITWKPSIHMPKKFARPERFEITDIRVERVQDIGVLDCIAEGVDALGRSAEQIRSDFWRLWDSINAKRGYGWEMNCWVWVICYRKL